MHKIGCLANKGKCERKALERNLCLPRLISNLNSVLWRDWNAAAPKASDPLEQPFLAHLSGRISIL